MALHFASYFTADSADILWHAMAKKGAKEKTITDYREADPAGYQEIIDTFNRQFAAKIKKHGGIVIAKMEENENVSPVALTPDGLFSGRDEAIKKFLKQKVAREHGFGVQCYPTLPLKNPKTGAIVGINFLEITKCETWPYIKKLKALSWKWKETNCLESRIPDFSQRLKKAWYQLNPPQLKLREPLVTTK
jgi:hypothetical protein